LDIGRRELRRGTSAVPVAPQVFDLLEYLLRHRERVVSKDDLIAAIWEQRIVSDAALTTRINVARSAIADTGEEQRLIKTLPRKGFRFVGAAREEPGIAGETSFEAPSAMKPPDKPSVAVLPCRVEEERGGEQDRRRRVRASSFVVALAEKSIAPF